MNTTENIDKKHERVFPEEKIITLDGNVLECYPLAEAEEVVDDSLKLDTTGRYLIVGRKPFNPSRRTRQKRQRCERCSSPTRSICLPTRSV